MYEQLKKNNIKRQQPKDKANQKQKKSRSKCDNNVYCTVCFMSMSCTYKIRPI